jgi:hypothetical protein
MPRLKDGGFQAILAVTYKRTHYYIKRNGCSWWYRRRSFPQHLAKRPIVVYGTL